MTTTSHSMLRRAAGSLLAAGCLVLTSAPGWGGGLVVTSHNKAGEVMSDAIIYAIPLDAHGLPPAPGKPEISTVAQEHLQFTPYVTAVRLGSEIRFPNYDKVEHHVKSFSPAKEFEIKPYEKVTPPPVLFDKTGVVVIYCLIHEWMRAYVYVVDTPYFGKSDSNGLVSLEDLPPGNYELRAWHPDMGTIKSPLTQPVKITADGVQQLKFDFDFIPKKRKPSKMTS